MAPISTGTSGSQQRGGVASHCLIIVAVAFGTCWPCTTGINPAVARVRCGERADVAADLVCTVGGGTKERGLRACGNFLATRLARCGLGSSVNLVLGVMTKGCRGFIIACGDCDNCGFWDARDVRDPCGDCENCGFCDASDFWDTCGDRDNCGF